MDANFTPAFSVHFSVRLQKTRSLHPPQKNIYKILKKHWNVKPASKQMLITHNGRFTFSTYKELPYLVQDGKQIGRLWGLDQCY